MAEPLTLSDWLDICPDPEWLRWLETVIDEAAHARVGTLSMPILANARAVNAALKQHRAKQTPNTEQDPF